jgi:predicted CopG family antitoxin
LFLSGLDVDWDVVKKKAVQKSEAPDEAQGNEITEQAAEAMSAATPKESEAEKPKKEKKKKRPVRCIQRHTDVEFRRQFRGVCKSLIKKAKAGGIQETRLLLQIGKFGDAKAAKRRGAKSLSEMLLDELKRRQDEREGAADSTTAEEQITAVKNASSEGATSGSDSENG